MSNTGRLVQIIGSTFDAAFEPGHLPQIYHAVEIRSDGPPPINLVGEVQQHLGGGKVRCVALGPTDGLASGMEVIDTGQSVTVPVGKEVLGRVMNLVGEPIDGGGPIQTAERRPIHHLPPPLVDVRPSNELFETGIKVIDLLAPFVRGGKTGLFGGADAVEGVR